MMAGCLARYYGWTYEQIADMTPVQCKAAIDAAISDSDPKNMDSGQPGLDGNLHFSTKAQWDLWRQTRGMS